MGGDWELETLIPGLQQQVHVGLSHLDEIEQEEHALKQHEAEIAANEEFTYTVEVSKPRKRPLPGTVTTTCLTCNFTRWIVILTKLSSVA